MIVINPLYLIIICTIATWETSLSIIFTGEYVSDPLYEVLKELICIVLFYGIISMLYHPLGSTSWFIAIILVPINLVYLLVGFLGSEKRNYDHLPLLGVLVMMLYVIIGDYSILAGLLGYIIMKLAGVSLYRKEVFRNAWSYINRYKAHLVLAAIDTSFMVLIFWGCIP